ncbi:uncharacterized protein LOC129257573 isoform X2 [Lytechinus pictus]|uniref:uncharacterized protein LOC129257573 isoform X2 n=1 Tax=Lytechinus pictus TaxID=7653 RepID=UPI00240D8750|nr:uncharacterized protein LOC129257573 [Lytechinus pictus]
MKSVLLLLCAVAMACGTPVSSTDAKPSTSQSQSTDTVHSDAQSNDETIVDSAMYIQSVSHMAVVEMLSPLMSAMSSLDLQISKIHSIAVKTGVSIPSVIVPDIDMTVIYKCKAKSEPKFSPALPYLVSKREEIKTHTDTATLIAHGIEYVSNLLAHGETDQKTLEAMSSKLSDFLSKYSSLISGLTSSVCLDDKSQSRESVDQKVPQSSQESMDPALEIFYRGFCPTGICFDK